MIRRIFMLQGTIIGFVGTLLGYGMGLSLGWALKRYRFIKLPENVYTLDHLPIIITWQDVLIIGASAMLLCFLATLYPARQAARALQIRTCGQAVLRPGEPRDIQGYQPFRGRRRVPGHRGDLRLRQEYPLASYGGS